MSNNPEAVDSGNHAGPREPGVPPLPRSVRRRILGIGVLWAVFFLVVLVVSDPTTALVFLGAPVPGLLLGVLFQMRRHAAGHDIERTDERSWAQDVSARAQAYTGISVLLVGVAVYQWIQYGLNQAQPFLYLVYAALLIYGLATVMSRRRS